MTITLIIIIANKTTVVIIIIIIIIKTIAITIIRPEKDNFLTL